MGQSRGSTPLRRFWCPLLIAFVGLAQVAGAPGPPASPELRVVVITLDTLRNDAFEGSAAPLQRTRARAEKGLIFRRFYSATSSTQPSHATLFTGLHPWQHGVPRNGVSLSADQETLAERFHDEGFRTAAAVASFPVHRRFGFKQGFDEYFDEFSEGDVARWSGVRNREMKFFNRGDRVVAQAFEMLDRLGGTRQFFWFHLFDPHSPYGDGRPPEERVSPTPILEAVALGEDAAPLVAHARTLYDEDCRYLDVQLDALLARLERDADQVETHILVVSDHGESFGEDGSLGHGKRLTRGQIQVPFFILSPKVAPALRDDPAGTADIPATALELAGLSTSLGESRSLLAPDSQRRVVGMRRTFAKPFEDPRTDGRVLTLDGLRFFAVFADEVYTGTSESVTLFDSERLPSDAAAARSAARLFQVFERGYAGLEIQEADDPETLERLRALGYVQ